MALSTLTTVPTIADKSEATPGLWNNIFGVIERNVNQLRSDVSAPLNTPISTNTIRPESGNTTTVTGVLSAGTFSATTFSTNTIRPESGTTVSLEVTAFLVARSLDSGGQVYNVRSFATAAGVTRTSVQLAIESAAAHPGGGTVSLGMSTVTLSSGLTLRSNVVLEGPGALIASGDFKVLNLSSNETNVTIRALTVDSQQTIGGALGHQVELSGCRGITIERCRFLGARLSAIRVHNSSDVWIVGNVIETPYEHGIYASCGGLNTGLFLFGNSISTPGSTATTGSFGKGIHVVSSSGLSGVYEDVKIIGNRVKDARHVSIELFTDDLAPHEIRKAQVLGNHVEESLSGSDTILYSMAGCRDITLTGNTGEGGVITFEIAYSKRVAFLANNSRGCRDIAISVSQGVDGDQTAPTDFQVQGNTVSAPVGAALQVFGAAGVKNFLVANNVFTGSGGSAGARGVFINSLGSRVSFVVANNVITGFGRSGLYINGTYDGVVTGNLCSGNNSAGSSIGDENDIYLNTSTASLQNTIRFADNIGGTSASFPLLRTVPELLVPLSAILATAGSATTPGYAFSSETSLGFYRSGASTIAMSRGTLNLATHATRLSLRTLSVSAITVSAANTNVAADEVVFAIGGASGASLAIHSGGTVYIFNSALSASAT